MAITVNIGGVNFSVPETGERSWGQNTTDLLVALADASYLILGGNIPLTSEADFGATAGLKAIYFASRSANVAQSGAFRLANLDNLTWRNFANSADLNLTTDASDRLTFEGSVLAYTSELPVVPVDSVFGRTGAVVAESNDYTWAQIDKTVSDIADITNKSHTSLTDVGVNTHAQIDAHIADTNNPHRVTAAQVGLGNVDNTSDADKPVSTAQQAALDLKQDDVVTTRGDVIVGDATGAASRVGLGASGQVLTSDGTDAVWADATGGGGGLEIVNVADGVGLLNAEIGKRYQVDTTTVPLTINLPDLSGIAPADEGLALIEIVDCAGTAHTNFIDVQCDPADTIEFQDGTADTQLTIDMQGQSVTLGRAGANTWCQSSGLQPSGGGGGSVMPDKFQRKYIQADEVANSTNFSNFNNLVVGRTYRADLNMHMELSSTGSSFVIIDVKHGGNTIDRVTVNDDNNQITRSTHSTSVTFEATTTTVQLDAQIQNGFLRGNGLANESSWTLTELNSTSETTDFT